MFTNELCMIREHTLRMLIGACELQGGFIVTYPSGHIWQWRWGWRTQVLFGIDDWDRNKSSQLLFFIYDISNCFDSKNNFVCDTCYRARQTHSPFPLSKSNELIALSWFIVIYGDHFGNHHHVVHITFLPWWMITARGICVSNEEVEWS